MRRARPQLARLARLGLLEGLGGLLAVLAATTLAGAAISAELDPGRTASWVLPEADLYDVDARGELAWAVGYWGTVLRTEDAGRTWRAAATPTDATLYAVSFADERHGWAVGALGAMLRSTDGGRSWTPQPVTVSDAFGDAFPLDSHLFGVSALGPEEAWAVGDLGIVLHTRDGGDHWEQVVIDPESFADDDLPDRILNAVHFRDREHGWIAGEFATTLRTDDGGATWVGERTFEGAAPDLYLFDLAGAGNGQLATVGLAGSVLVSGDGGATWQTRAAPTTAGLYGVAWGPRSGTVAGDRGELFVSRDGGRSWTSPERPRLFNWLRGVAYASRDRVYTVGEKGVILRSEDGGATWEDVSVDGVPEPVEPGGRPGSGVEGTRVGDGD